MRKALKYLLIGAVILFAPKVSQALTGPFVQITTNTLQPGTTNGFYVSKGRAIDLYASTFTINGNVIKANSVTTSTFTIPAVGLDANFLMSQGTAQVDGSTTTHSGKHTFTTIDGNIADLSTGTHSGAQTFSSMTTTGLNVTNSVTAASGTVNGQLQVTTLKFSADASTMTSANTGFVRNVSTGNVTSSSQTSITASFVFTNLSTSLTLKQATNKVFLMASGTTENSANDGGCDYTFFRDNTNIGASAGIQRGRNPAGTVVQQMPMSISYVDAPGDTSVHTYRLAFKAVAAGTCSFNSASQSSTLVGLEIGQ